MAEPFETESGALVRRNRLYLGLAASPFLLALAEIVLAVVGRVPQALVVLPHILIAGTVLTLFAWRKNHNPSFLQGKLRADERGVWFGGERIVPKEEIKSGLVLPRWDGGPVVRFRRRGFHLPVDVRVKDRDEARALLRALGLDASQSVATFSLPSSAFSDPDKRRKFAFVYGVAMATLGLSAAFFARVAPHFAPFLPLILAIAAISAVVTAVIPTKLQVGADGLHVKWLRRARFIGYGDVARIDPYEDPGRTNNALAGLMLTLKSGETIRIPILSKRSTVRDEIYILHERISEAIDTWSRGEGVAHAALVRRGARDASQWVRALRGIGAFANADARTAPVMPEKLWRIVEDPAAPADARAGAAVALGQAGDDEVRARLRAAASATAAPKLRFAIETAAKAEGDAALEAALAEVEAEAAQPQKA